ncbi:MAG TPA: class I SAM-dependent methyltransferase, partial [Candidatus Aminicenantes bacterium]|nr:class I SAM-dependent methyltransferase [Candidatus Aminicenantes bacterium]
MELCKIEDEDIIKFLTKKTSQRVLTLESASWLYTLARKAGEEKSICLEIGSGIGCSGIIIATAIKEKVGKLISIDSFLAPPDKSSSLWGERPWGPEVFRNNLKRFDIDPILIIGNSTEIVPLFKDKSFDLIWIDGCHEYESVKKDILNSIPKLKEDGILCGHDFRSAPDVPSNCVKKVVKKIFGDNFKVMGGRVW